MKSFSIDFELGNSSFNFIVVSYRIRLFPTLISKIKRCQCGIGVVNENSFKSKDQIAKNLIREDKQLNESDIEQMITSGRIIETDFGHLFDEIIINLSQDQTQRVS